MKRKVTAGLDQPAINAKKIVEFLKSERHPSGKRNSEWACFAELSNGTGWSTDRRYIDLFAINCWPSKGFRSVAYEVKVNRGDFMKELEDPTKRAFAESVAMECWFAVPLGLVQPDEVPDGWGLVTVGEKGTVKTAKMPLQRRPEPWDMPFIASMLRRAADPENKVPMSLWALAGQEIGPGDLAEAFRKENVEILKAYRREVTAEVRAGYEKEIAELVDYRNKFRDLQGALMDRLGIPFHDRWQLGQLPVAEQVALIDKPTWDTSVLRSLQNARKALDEVLKAAK